MKTRWSKVADKRRKDKDDIVGISGFDKRKDRKYPTGYCASINLSDYGELSIWSDGMYRFFNRKDTKKLINELKKRLEKLNKTK